MPIELTEEIGQKIEKNSLNLCIHVLATKLGFGRIGWASNYLQSSPEPVFPITGIQGFRFQGRK